MSTPTRRTFLSAAAATAAVPLVHPAVHAAGSDTIKIGLIGAGGRGRGAASDALAADKNTKLVAICDIFPDFTEESTKLLTDQFGKDRVDLPSERRYSGFDGYKQLIDTAGVDLVLLCTPPGFRPQHLKYAIDAGKHVFAEKPLAVDAPGVRSVLETAAVAKKKNLMCASGFCYRYEPAKRETVKRIQGGQIGDVLNMHVSYNTGYIWHRGNKPEWTEMEYQIRNWYYYTWLSGDHLVEQHCHNIDKACWVMGDMPIAASGFGGRTVRTDDKYGNVWDHFSVVYEYTDGRKVFSYCRQMPKCENDVSDYVYGTKGTAELQSHTVKAKGGDEWRFAGKNANMYLQEHREMLAGLRAGEVVNDMEAAAKSTLMAILGRQAAYTGKRLTWDEMAASKEALVPATFAWGPNPVPPAPKPGVTKFA